ncbi:DUF1624 domain-containing protein [Altererythrobacter indicus]|uniref:DUF1624 domain-containing protein n=1 Tax=Altericroceibacterium indicum TaxID=374177 RepID=A0A845A317_9SPHN|nr:DUF1624 domain-containing protein [Altericroceibacterium indicum]
MLYHRNCERRPILSTEVLSKPAKLLKSSTSIPSSRITSIDALRGLVMLLMLVDHARESFFMKYQVSDPMGLDSTSPDLFFTRLAAHFCAPVFVGLTGVAAWLYGQGEGRADTPAAHRAASAFLFKRGLFLIVLELTLVSFAWTFSFTPEIFYLQVIWAIGLSMIVLAAAVHLPRFWLVMLGAAIVLGHNLLDPIAVAPGEAGHVLWAMLHDRGMIDLPFGAQARTSYPLLPWFGVIMLGYALGPVFARHFAGAMRRHILFILGLASLAAFAVARFINIYGDPTPWEQGATPLLSVMSFLNVTKYPPSMDFLLLTLGGGLLLLAAFEKLPDWANCILSIFGSVPLFFYLFHLYALNLLNRAVQPVLGVDESGFYSVHHVWQIWAIAAALAVPSWFLCRWFARRKRASNQWWMRYL